jgi:hypothetical protein
MSYSVSKTADKFTPYADHIRASIVVNPEDVQQHAINLLIRTHVEALIHGNVRKDVCGPLCGTWLLTHTPYWPRVQDALAIMKKTENMIGSHSLTAAEKSSLRTMIFPAGM